MFHGTGGTPRGISRAAEQAGSSRRSADDADSGLRRKTRVPHFYEGGTNRLIRFHTHKTEKEKL
jgi:hypothetical protein